MSLPLAWGNGRRINPESTMLRCNGRMISVCSRLLPALLASVLAVLPAKAQQADIAVTNAVAQADIQRDIALLRSAVQAYRAGNVDLGDDFASQMVDREARWAAEWAAIRTQHQTLGTERLKRYLQKNRGVAMQAFVEKRYENALFVERASAADVFDFFHERDPQMPGGRLILALRLKERGFPRHAEQQVRRAWREMEISPDLDAFVDEHFRETLTVEDKRMRAWRLLAVGQTGLAYRAGLKVSAAEGEIIEALAAARRAKGPVPGLVAKLSSQARALPGYKLLLATHLRRSGKHVEAAKAMLGMARDAAIKLDGDGWWDEERALTRGLLNKNEPALAYAIARQAEPFRPDFRSEAQFLAGYIALEFLGDSAGADMHFQAARRLAASPSAKARAAFWSARGQIELSQESRRALEEAASFPLTFYGQAALDVLNQPLRLPPQPIASNWPLSKEAAKALQRDKLLEAAGAGELGTPLLVDLAATASDLKTLRAIGRVLDETAEHRLKVHVGRQLVNRGVFVPEVAFPVDALPANALASAPVEPALVFAIARQESGFDPKARSSANALGLMQMLPSTARSTARRLGVGFQPQDLINNPVLNATLGAAHLDELMRPFDRSLALVATAYNAGPRRSVAWSAAFGDPRSPDIDPIAWVERVPFDETRNYIIKVSENLQIYRALLTPHKQRGLFADLSGRDEPALP
jgi:soluble lytic murein transglycosylase